MLFIFWNNSVFAHIERRMPVLSSTNPSGVLFSGTIAYNQKIWDKSSDQFWQYGYIRPVLNYDTSILVNSGSFELQFYPLSFFGISAGTFYSKREVNTIEDFDCEALSCKGSLYKNYYRLDLGLGFNNILSKVVYQKDFYETHDTDKDMGEFGTVLILPQGSSQMERKILFLGYKISDRANVGYLGLRYSVQSASSQADYAVINYKYDKMNWTAGVGAFQSDYKRSRLAALVKVSWLFDPTLVLGD